MRKNYLYLLGSWFALMVCLGHPSFAQQRIVSGKVTDNGDGLPGVNILLKGTTNGTVSAGDGTYTLSISGDSPILVFSSIGFASQEIEVGNQTTIDVPMVTEVGQLSEVVVTALGVQRDKKALQYSMTEVAGDNLTQARVNNVGNALSGRVAGVNVSNLATGPAGSTRIIIRGNKSVNGNNQPLYVIDGIPMDNTVGSQAGQWSGQDQGDGLTSINPNDIESVNVLKGASASALYGSRGGNGVINIVTKKGAKRKGIGVDFNTNYVAERVINLSNLQKTYGTGGYVAGVPTAPTSVGNLRSGWYENEWGPKLGTGTFMGVDGVTRPYTNQGDNWKRFYQTGSSFTNTISLTGGGDKQTFRFSAADLKQNSIIPNSGFKRTNLSLSVNSKFGKKLTLDAKIMFSHEEAKNRPTVSDSPGNAVQAVWRVPNNVNINDLKGDPNKLGAIPEGTDPMLLAQYQRTPGQELLPSSPNNWGPNPWWVAYQHIYSDKRDRVLSSAQLRYDITDFLYASARVGVDAYAKRNTRLYPEGTGDNTAGSMQEGADRVQEVNMEWMLGFNKTFKKIGVNAYVGGNRMRRSNENTQIVGSGFNVSGFPFINNVGSRNFIYNYGGNGFGKSGINSIFASAELSYNNYLFLTGTYRKDWFSVLVPQDALAKINNPPAHNFIGYPSIGAGFVFSDAFQNLPPWLSFGKARASWARTGMIGLIQPYDVNLTYSLFGNTHLGATMGSFSSAQGRYGNIPNPSLVPALSTEVEFGLDTRFFNNLIGVDVTYYRQETTKDIVRASVPLTSGFGSRDVNVGKIQNRGIEILLTATPLKKAITWDVSVNFAKNKNKIVQLVDGLKEIVGENSRTQTTFVNSIVGESYGTLKGTKVLRDDQGRIVYNASGQPMQKAGDYEILGSTVANWTGGINNSISYKGFNLSFLIDIRIGGVLHSGTNVRLTQWGYSKESVQGRDGEKPIHINGVVQQSDGSYVPVDRDLTPDEARTYWGAAGDQNGPGLGNVDSRHYTFDAGYGKLRQVTLGYSLPRAMLTKTPFQKVSISLVSRNLAVLWKHVPNIDPESAYSANGAAQGLDYFGMPTSRTYGFNLNLGF